MAAPTLVQASAGGTDAGGAWVLPPDMASNTTPGNIIVFQVLQDGATSGAVTLTSASYFEDLAGTDGTLTFVGSFPVGGSSEAIQHIWIGRIRLSQLGVAISGGNSTSEDVYVRAYEFSNVSTGTTLATVIENATAGSTVNEVGTSATAADASVQTLGPDRLALNLVAVNDDNAISAFTGETGGDWTLAVAPYAEASGTDGAIGLQIATNPAALRVITDNATDEFCTGSAQYLKVAQSFSAPGSSVEVGLHLRKWGSPTDNAVIEIQTDSGGNPSGTAVGSATIPGASLTTTPTMTYVVLSAAMTAASSYWLVLSRSGGVDATNYYSWSASTAGGNPYSGGLAKTHTSGSWVNAANLDLTFVILTSSNTINGGTGSIVDSDAWGVVGFALIGTTPAGKTITVPPAAATAAGLTPVVYKTGAKTITVPAPGAATATGLAPVLVLQLAPPVAAATAAGLAPQVAIILAPPAAAATAAGLAPTVFKQTSRTIVVPAPSAATAAGLAPVVSRSKTIVCPAAAATASAASPAVVVSDTVVSPVATATAPTLTVVVARGLARAPPAASATASAPAPNVVIARIVTAPAASATASSTSPALLKTKTIAAPVAAATAVGLAPTVSKSTDVVVAAPAAAATAAGLAPSISISHTVEAPAAAATATGVAPTVSTGRILSVPPAEATGAAPTAAVSRGKDITSPAASANAEAPTATVAAWRDATVSAPTASATATATASLSLGRVIALVTASATATGLAPTVSRSRALDIPTAAGTATGLAPTVSRSRTVDAPSATATATGLAPVVSRSTFLAVTLAVATAEGIAPTILRLQDALLVVPSATATASCAAPSVWTVAPQEHPFINVLIGWTG